jgi:hypothetical protein
VRVWTLGLLGCCWMIVCTGCGAEIAGEQPVETPAVSSDQPVGWVPGNPDYDRAQAQRARDDEDTRQQQQQQQDWARQQQEQQDAFMRQMQQP